MKIYKVTITQERYLQSIDSWTEDKVEVTFEDYATAYVLMEMIIEHSERTKCSIETIEKEER